MKLSRTQLARAISTQTVNHGVDKKLANDLAKILMHTDKTSSLDSLMRDVVRNWAELGYIDVITRSAFPLSNKVKQDITHLIKQYYPHAKQIKIIENIDEDVVAGVVLEFADMQLDLSVETKINKFKQHSAAGRKD